MNNTVCAIQNFDLEGQKNFLHHEHVSQHRPSRYTLLASLKPSDEWAIHGQWIPGASNSRQFCNSCADVSVVATVCTFDDTGKKQYQDCAWWVHGPIKNSLALFTNFQRTATSNQGKKTKVLQKNVTLCGQLYISMQNRDVDLAEFLHTRYSPPSLHHFQTLVASFIWHIRRLNCSNVLSSLGNQSHLQRTTAQSWMMPSSFTAHPLPATAPSMNTQPEEVWDT